MIKRLKKLLKENEAATENLVKAIESGKAVDVLSAQIEKRQREKVDIEAQLAQEQMIKPILTYEEVKFFFEKFKAGDVNDITCSVALIDTFISKIYRYDGEDARMEIFCNTSNQGISIPIGEPDNGSPMGQLTHLLSI